MSALSNGTAPRLDLDTLPKSRGRKPSKPTSLSQYKVKPSGLRQQVSALPPAKKAALALGLVGCFLLVLSLWHCTSALMVLTGSPMALAFCLAVGVDCGLVTSEVAAIVGRDSRAARWATAYIVLSIVLSMGLNALGNTLHAPVEYRPYAIATGVAVPLLVFIIGKATSYLWEKR